MKEILKGLVLELLGSKKFAGLLAGLLVVVAVYPLTRWAGFDEAGAKALAEPIAQQAVALVGTYLIGQGIADVGKAKALAAKEPRIK